MLTSAMISIAPGIVACGRPDRNAGGLLGLDQGLVEPPRGLGIEDVAQDLHRGELGMRGGRDVIEQADQPDVADPAQRDESLAVLRRLLGVGLRELAVGLGQRAKVFRDVFKCFLFVELAGDDEHGVVGLVEFLVEGPQVVDRHALDVGAVADGRLAVVVPLVGDGHHPLRQHALGRVLARSRIRCGPPRTRSRGPRP